ncbi:MAG TPA: hypothetical protein VM734_23590, partial [Kofleriaceae bacterium]|nr:hypothetical protein [Kofleriaceae bacterium]
SGSASAEPPPSPDPDPQPDPTRQPPPLPPADPYADPRPALGITDPPPPPRPPLQMQFPNILLAPSGRMLPAAVIWSSTGVHTGGSVYSDIHVGLGDVAEFGLSVTDLIRLRSADGLSSEPIEPFAMASFKMGVGEHQLVRHQPAVALTFRKSFEHQHDGAKVRTAALYLVASKSLGARVTLHGGGVVWDAALTEADGRTYYFHDAELREQVRPFGAIEVEPKPRSQIMVELSWVPKLQRSPTRPSPAELSALLAWGVRYRVTTLLAFESGVRVEGIQDANLLDAQIFGQLSWGTDKLRRAIHSLND